MRILGHRMALMAMLATWPIFAQGPGSGVQLTDMDRSVRPQDDFFAYANGTWLRETQIPADRSRYGVDSLMEERSMLRRRALAEAARSASDPEARKVGDLYASFMDEAAIEARGIHALDAELHRIEAIKDPRDLAPAMARLDRIGVPVPLGGYVEPDSKNPGRYAFWITQGGLGLPDRDYYDSDDAKLAGMREQYRSHIRAMLTLARLDHADRRADAIFALETRIAAIEWKTVDRRDPRKSYNPRTPAELEHLAPAIAWKRFFAEEHLPHALPVLIARQPDYLAHLSEEVRATPLPVWKDYLRYRLLAATAPYLSHPFAEAEFAFSEGVLHGTPAMPERWKRGVELVDQLMGEAGGKMYVARYFPPEARIRAEQMVQTLLAVYRDSLGKVDWMGPATRAEAQAKLAALTIKIGYPDHWRDYGALSIASDDLVGNVQRAQAFEADRKRAQTAGPVDRAEWSMTVPTVDAYYEAGRNEMALPAGILQPPLFDPSADDAYNYGSTGATIGHEISHGFDSRGSRYDAKGDLRDWWTPDDRRAYDARTDLLVREFDGFEPIPGYHVNGTLTLPENIADLAGLEIAHAAYLRSLNGGQPPVIDGLTGDQRFFLGYAQSYLGKRRDELLIAQLKSNPHPPERYRVNGLVAHLQAFYDAFQVGPGDRMYIPPEQRAVLWR